MVQPGTSPRVIIMRKPRIESLLFVLSLLPCICPTPVLAADKTTGKATIYSDKFDGKPTATGAQFKNQEVSAASNKLPLGSRAVVKNKKTGKSVVVKINDRMSKKSSAVVDLSKGAAKKIGVNGSGQVDAHVVSSKKK